MHHVANAIGNVPGTEDPVRDYAAGSNAGSDDADHHINVAMVDGAAAAVGRGLVEEVEVKDWDAAGTAEAVLADGVGSWPSRRSIPGSRPLRCPRCTRKSMLQL